MPSRSDQQRTVLIKHEGLRSVGAFAAFPTKIIRNADLSIGARMTYALLLSYAWQEDFCFPAQEKLAEDLGVTDRQVRRLLIELRDKGFIEWKQQGLNRPNIYSILEIEPPNPPSTPPSASNDDEDSDRTSASGPDRTRASGHERTQMSDYKETNTKTQYTRQRRGVSREVEDKKSIAEVVATDFHRLAGHPLSQKPLKKEIAQATGLLTRYDHDTVNYVVRFAVEKGAETNFRMQHFGAVLGYVEQALAERDAIAVRAERERLVREQRDKEEADRRAEQAAFEALPAEERAKVHFDRWTMFQEALRKRIPESERAAKWRETLEEETAKDIKRGQETVSSPYAAQQKGL